MAQPLGGCAAVNVNQSSIDSLDHLRSVPADGTLLEGMPSATYWQIQSGKRSSIASPGSSAVQVTDVTLQRIPLW